MRLVSSIVLLFALFFVGCVSPASRFSLVEVGVPSLDGLSSLHGRAVLSSRSGRDLVVESVRLVVRYRGRELGAARLLLPVRVVADVVSAVRYDFVLDGFTPSGLQTLFTRFPVSADSFTVDVTGVVAWGCVRKKIVVKDLPLTYIISTFTP